MEKIEAIIVTVDKAAGCTTDLTSYTDEEKAQNDFAKRCLMLDERVTSDEIEYALDNGHFENQWISIDFYTP